MIDTALFNAIVAINDYRNDTADHLVLAKCRALMHGYHARWKNAGYVPESVERTMLADLYNPDTLGKSRSFQVAGKLDVVASYFNRRVLIDHKTTTQDITDPNAHYWRQLVVEGQVSHYMLLQWMHGEKCDDAVWDVIHKPQISPKKLAKADIKAVVSLGTYYGLRVSDADKQTFIDGSERETLSMYEARLRHDCSQERPEYYFARRSVPRIDAEIMEYARDLWQHGQDILYTRQLDRMPPKNGGACLLYGTPCKFLGICSGHDTPESDRWQRKEHLHPELPEANGNDKQLLTNSRVRCFMTCRRKHYYEFELGIERIDEEEKESLFFGTCLHSALEAWWGTFLPEVKDERDGQSSVSGAGNSAAEPQVAR